MSIGIYKHKASQGFQKGHIVPLEWRKKLSKASIGRILSKKHM